MATNLDPDSYGWQIRCAICGPTEDRFAQPLLMSRGITVWLCDAHIATQYRLQNGGVTFVDALTTVWESSSGLTIRRQEALAAHMRWVRQVTEAMHPPRFITPWLGPAPSNGAKQRKRRMGKGLRPPASFLRPVKPPTPRPPDDGPKPPQPPPAGAPIRRPKPPRRPSGQNRAQPDDRPP